MAQETEEEVEDNTEYDTGPFCRHFGDPADCDIECLHCGHPCFAHGQEPGNAECHFVSDAGVACTCMEWELPEDFYDEDRGKGQDDPKVP
jgi:hypothetical protein